MQAATGAAVSELPWEAEDGGEDIGALADYVHKRLDRQFTPWGVAIEQVGVSNLTNANVVSVIGGE